MGSLGDPGRALRGSRGSLGGPGRAGVAAFSCLEKEGGAKSTFSKCARSVCNHAAELGMAARILKTLISVVAIKDPWDDVSSGSP